MAGFKKSNTISFETTIPNVQILTPFEVLRVNADLR